MTQALTLSCCFRLTSAISDYSHPHPTPPSPQPRSHSHLSPPSLPHLPFKAWRGAMFTTQFHFCQSPRWATNRQNLQCDNYSTQSARLLNRAIMYMHVSLNGNGCMKGHAYDCRSIIPPSLFFVSSLFFWVASILILHRAL